jgi:hypothetical protein
MDVDSIDMKILRILDCFVPRDDGAAAGRGVIANEVKQSHDEE